MEWMRGVLGQRRMLPVLAVLALAFLAAAPAQQYQPPHNKPGPAAETLTFRAFDVDRAPADLLAGNMDLYAYNLKTAAAKELQSNQNVKLYQAPATTLSLVLNPAPAPSGQLNPFSLLEVRRALQYLVNRDFVANEVYQGLGLPMTTPVSPVDYDYLTVYDVVRSTNITYDPDLAKKMIDDAMTKAGATKADNVWTFQKRPVVIKFIIRVEDERRDIGDTVRAALEDAGFQVQPIYQTFAPAVQTVYSTDPKLLQWHMYTEGWSRGSPDKYDFSNINQMTAPWMGNMPGWQEVGFWQYENAKLDEMGQKLFTGNFASKEERDTIYAEMTKLGMEESVRVWVATVMNTFPTNPKLAGVSLDLVSGPRNALTLREAYVPGSDTLKLGNLWVWTERTVWNPVGGFGDAYSAAIWQGLFDPPMINNPSSGVPQPFRAAYTVDTAGPTGKLEVPQDAVLWDAEGNRWKPVGGGVQATSKAVFDYAKYFSSKWHNGSPITMADVVYSIAQGYEIAYDPEKVKIETALGVTSRPYLKTFKGFKVLDKNKIEVYVDFWHFEKDYIAAFASPAGLSMPWEVLATLDDLVFRERKAAYSDTAAQRFSVPWVSLAIRTDATLVRRQIRALQESGFVPQGVFQMGSTTLVDANTAKARYQADLDWFDKYGILVISNGPYFLARYDPPAQYAELKAFRDPTYPFKPGDWHTGAPQLVEFTSVNAGGVRPGQAADIAVGLQGPGAMAVQYQLYDPAAGKVIAQGQAQKKDDKSFTVSLGSDVTSQLQPGLYKLYLAGSSDQVARITERAVDLNVSTTAQTTPGAGTTPTPGKAAGGCGTSPEAPAEAAYLFVGVGLVWWWRRRRA